MEALDLFTLEQRLADLDGWAGNQNGISRTFTFNDFPDALAFMVACAPGIEFRNHHPEWSNVYNRVAVTLRTHDAGNQVTELDIDLAGLLNERYVVFTTPS